MPGKQKKVKKKDLKSLKESKRTLESRQRGSKLEPLKGRRDAKLSGRTNYNESTGKRSKKVFTSSENNSISRKSKQRAKVIKSGGTPDGVKKITPSSYKHGGLIQFD